MKKQIRFGVFETNSSSTHSLVLCNEKDYEDWTQGKLFLCKYAYGYDGAEKGKFYTKEEVEAFATKKGYSLKNALGYGDFVSYDNYWMDDYEWFDDEIVTPSGDKVIAVGYFGYNG